MLFLAEWLKARQDFQPLVLLGSEIPFPFTARPSRILLSGIPAGVIACAPLLEDWGIPSRLASLQGYPGCFAGTVTELAREWLLSLDLSLRREVEIFACGPAPMLRATAHLCAELALPGQISLEEYMACAVGGCAGCTVRIKTPEGPRMQRVCVDGPVFDAQEILF
jgi:dihydroorotate dehydrogenase electron transfer subunit